MKRRETWKYAMCRKLKGQSCLEFMWDQHKVDLVWDIDFAIVTKAKISALSADQQTGLVF